MVAFACHLSAIYVSCGSISKVRNENKPHSNLLRSQAAQILGKTVISIRGMLLCNSLREHDRTVAGTPP